MSREGVALVQSCVLLKTAEQVEQGASVNCHEESDTGLKTICPIVYDIHPQRQCKTQK